MRRGSKENRCFTETPLLGFSTKMTDLLHCTILEAVSVFCFFLLVLMSFVIVPEIKI